MGQGLQLDEQYLVYLLDGGGAFVNAPGLLNDLSAEQATREIDGVNHTIARVVAHLGYWQNWTYDGITGSPRPYPESNEVTFPGVDEGEWQACKDNFFEGLAAIKTLCSNPTLLTKPFAEGKISEGSHNTRNNGMTILYTVALHNAHHYGQIITQRQIMGIWPPATGGMGW